MATDMKVDLLSFTNKDEVEAHIKSLAAAGNAIEQVFWQINWGREDIERSEVAIIYRPKAWPLILFGRNEYVKNTVVDVWQGPTDQVALPLIAENLEVIAHADNAPGGIGAQVVDLVVLDTPDADTPYEQSTIKGIALNGATPVAVPGGPYWRVNYGMVQAVGSAGTVSGGPVQVRGAATGNVYLTIEPGLNNSTQAIYTVPAGNNCLVRGWQCSLVARRNDSMVTAELLVRAPGSSTFKALDMSPQLDENLPQYASDLGLELPPGSDIKVTARAEGAPTEFVDARFYLVR